MIEYHGPRFADWIKTERPGWAIELSESDKRRLRDHAAGTPVSDRVADRICCQLDLHLAFIPDAIELPDVDRFTKTLIRRDLGQGYWPDEIARLLDLPAGLVRSFA